jgi:uncharacterized protein
LVQLEHSFEVGADPDRAMALMLDGERVIPCMPGAALDRKVDDTHWKAKMTVALGPVKMMFTADVTVDEVDHDARRARLVFTGRDTRGMGGAQGKARAHFVPVEGGRTRVEMTTDVSFSGKAAQLGRPNVVNDVSQALVGRFARCLEVQLTSTDEEAARVRDESSKPLSGTSVLGTAIKGSASRLFGRDRDDDEAKGDSE